MEIVGGICFIIFAAENTRIVINLYHSFKMTTTQIIIIHSIKHYRKNIL